MYFYYVDVSKLEDNKAKLNLREKNSKKSGWELFSVNYAPQLAYSRICNWI